MLRSQSVPRPARLFVICVGLFAAGFLTNSRSQAEILFNFDYTDNVDNVGFLDPTEGSARQAALVTAGQLFSNLFGSHFSNIGTISFAVTSTDSTSVDTLASAGSNFQQSPGTFGGGEVIRNKLVSGTDLNGASLDGYVDVNWGYAWELDPNTPAVAPGAGQTFDFYAAMFHEFTHALGFGSEISGTPGSDRFDEGSSDSGTPGSWSKWDQFLTDKDETPLIDPVTKLVNADAFANAKANGGLFTGPNALLATDSQANLFANSDQSHLDEATFSMPTKDMNFMMKPNRDYGPQEARTWSSLEIGILTDLGYSRVSAVPEPGTFAVILVGALAVETRRRRRAKIAG